MRFSETSLQTAAGEFAMIDYGGSGPDCLLIHGTGQNALAWRQMLRRCFVEKDGGWLRRPTLDEIRIVSQPDAGARIKPGRTIYDQVDVPMLLVWAQRGLAADRLPDLKSLVAKSPNRTLATIDACHNVPMQKPAELAQLILTHL